MARIADRMGLATSAIYRHFPGKDELLDAVIDLIGSRLEANVAAASRASEDALARLEFLLQRHVAGVLEHGGIPRLLFSGDVFCGSGGKSERLYRLITGYLAGVAKIIRAGQRAGGIRVDLDAQALAVHFLGIVQPAVILGHLSGVSLMSPGMRGSGNYSWRPSPGERRSCRACHAAAEAVKGGGWSWKR
jgi:AcrR family transcriptional regulator